MNNSNIFLNYPLMLQYFIIGDELVLGISSRSTTIGRYVQVSIFLTDFTGYTMFGVPQANIIPSIVFSIYINFLWLAASYNLKSYRHDLTAPYTRHKIMMWTNIHFYLLKKSQHCYAMIFFKIKINVNIYFPPELSIVKIL